MAGGDGKLILYGDKDLASPYVMSVGIALAFALALGARVAPREGARWQVATRS